MYQLLIVDDEPLVQAGIRSMLNWNELNIEICGTAMNGKAALEMIRQYRPDIVITDIKMPVMNGLEASRQIRSLSRPDGNMIPILAMTAQDAISVSSQCRQYGMDDYVLKPADPEQLTKMILKYVKTI